MEQNILQAAQEYEGIVTPQDLHAIFNVIQLMQINGGYGSFTVVLGGGHVKDVTVKIDESPSMPTATPTPTPASAWLSLLAYLSSSWKQHRFFARLRGAWRKFEAKTIN